MFSNRIQTQINQDKEKIRNNEIKYLDSVTFEGVLEVKKNEEEAIKEIINELNITSFIDCGCGTGYYTEYFSNNINDCYGIDISKDAVKLPEPAGKTSTVSPRTRNLSRTKFISFRSY